MLAEYPAFPSGNRRSVRDTFGTSSLQNLEHPQQTYERIECVLTRRSRGEAIFHNIPNPSAVDPVCLYPVQNCWGCALSALLLSLAAHETTRDADVTVDLPRIGFGHNDLTCRLKLGDRTLERPEPDRIQVRRDNLSPPGDRALSDLIAPERPEEHAGCPTLRCRAFAASEQIKGRETERIEQSVRVGCPRDA